ASRTLRLHTPTATSQVSTISLHDALPISRVAGARAHGTARPGMARPERADQRADARPAGRTARQPAGQLSRVRRHQQPHGLAAEDRKSTRLNSSHVKISYAVFCLKKKKPL